MGSIRNLLLRVSVEVVEAGLVIISTCKFFQDGTCVLEIAGVEVGDLSTVSENSVLNFEGNAVTELVTHKLALLDELDVLLSDVFLEEFHGLGVTLSVRVGSATGIEDLVFAQHSVESLVTAVVPNTVDSLDLDTAVALLVFATLAGGNVSLAVRDVRASWADGVSRRGVNTAISVDVVAWLLHPLSQNARGALCEFSVSRDQLITLVGLVETFSSWSAGSADGVGTLEKDLARLAESLWPFAVFAEPANFLLGVAVLGADGGNVAAFLNLGASLADGLGTLEVNRRVLGPADTGVLGGLLKTFSITVVAVLTDSVGVVGARSGDELIFGTLGAELALGIDSLGAFSGLEASLRADAAWSAVFTEVAGHRGGALRVEVSAGVQLLDFDVSPLGDWVVTVTLVALLVGTVGALDVLPLAVGDWFTVAAESVLEEGASTVSVLVGSASLASDTPSNVRSLVAHLSQVHDLNVSVWIGRLLVDTSSEEHDHNSSENRAEGSNLLGGIPLWFLLWKLNGVVTSHFNDQVLLP